MRLVSLVSLSLSLFKTFSFLFVLNKYMCTVVWRREDRMEQWSGLCMGNLLSAL